MFTPVRQEYNEFGSSSVQTNIASQEDCNQMVKDSSVWFTEDDICQFMNRNEEDVDEPPPTED